MSRSSFIAPRTFGISAGGRSAYSRFGHELNMLAVRGWTKIFRQLLVLRRRTPILTTD